MNPTPPQLQNLRTIRDLVRWGASEFARAGLVFGHGSDNALDEAFHLVLWKLHLPFDLPAAYLEAQLTETECGEVVELLSARVLTRKPAPYLTGEAWFAGLSFYVDERVLIPRSPMAEMIGRQFEPWLATPPTRILDLCAGSGCIGIACALEFSEATVDLAEIEAGALEVAERNVHRHHVERRVTIACGDLFAPIGKQRYDLIVSNPPYVPHAEWAALAPEYRHEPQRALEAGSDGMNVVARILADAATHLEDDGTLVCEIGGSREEFDARFPATPGMWPEFEHGGDGVFVISRKELEAWRRAKTRGKKAAG